MTTPPVSPNPLGDAAATVDQVPLAVRAIGAEVAVAICCLALVTWGTLQLAGPDVAPTRQQIDPSAAYVNLLLFGTVSTMPITALVGWRLMRSITNTWRRTGLVATGVLAGLVAGMLATIAAREIGGPAGLLVLALLALLLARLLAIAAGRAAATAAAQ
jgi:hypothetical protein